MRSIRGNLSFMSVMDIIQWADQNKRSGTLTLFLDERQKKFYLQEGQLIFVWSECEGERIADFLQFETLISQQKLSAALADAEMLGLSFIGYLYSQKIISKQRLDVILRQVAETALASALGWETGTFEFIDELPAFVYNGPVRLNSTQVLLEAVKRFDESRQKADLDITKIITELKCQVEHGNIELPPIPDIMLKIMTKIDNVNVSIDDVIECITDQILVSKILRVCNSPYYRRAGNISTLRDAVLYIGFKPLMSIVTVHSLSSFSPRNAEQIRKVLQHCLVCGMIARQIARDLRLDHEQAFICGLLHDIGKTIMLDMLHDYIMTEEIREQLIGEYHAEIGYLLARKWNFDEFIQNSIRYHHSPERAGEYAGLVEIVYLSDNMSHSMCHDEAVGMAGLHTIDLNRVNVTEMLERLESIDQAAREIVNL